MDTCVYLRQPAAQIVSETDGVTASPIVLLGSFESGRIRESSSEMA
jgi:hypothetical protein